MATYDIVASNNLMENPSPRCPCMLVLDISGSMAGPPIQELNEGVRGFFAELKEDDIAAYSIEVGVITAGDQVTEQLPFTVVTAIEGCQEFVANGNTPLGAAVELALRRLEERKAAYKANGVAYYQPWLVIISDGQPNDNWVPAASYSRQLQGSRGLVVLSVGVNNADMDILSKFSTRPALKLEGLKFKEFFQWLSASMARVSASASTSSNVTLPERDSWESI